MELLIALALAGIVLFFVSREWNKVAKLGQAIADRQEQTLKSELALVREERDSYKVIAEAEKAKREMLEDSVKRTVKSQVESRALPWYPRSDREEAQMEEEMKRPSREEYQDEVAGLGR